MIADLDESLKQLLSNELPNVKSGEIDVKFEQPKREWSARLTRPTINLFLYDVRENSMLRRHEWQQMAPHTNGGRVRDNLMHLKRTPLRLDCQYILTTWATTPEDEHRLLTNCLLVLFRHPKLPEDALFGDMKNQPYEIQTQLASHDKLVNPAEVWSALDNEVRPSISYVLTVALDPWSVVAKPIASTVSLRSSQIDAEDASQTSNLILGKLIRDEEPLTGITIRMKERGALSQTDEKGKFTFSNVSDGTYTLMIELPEGDLIERPIKVPDINYLVEV